jgi:hypothetical protein
LLARDLSVANERQLAPDPSALAIDPHGRYVAVASQMGTTQLFNRYGRLSGRFETRQALAHLCFIPALPLLLGAAAYGTLAGVEFEVSGSSGRLNPSVLWQESLMSNVGRLTASGEGGVVLASCFTHGIQRFDVEGQNEGSYHLGGTAAHAVPDFTGRMIAASTSEGDLAILSSGGHVRWKTGLVRPASALEVDPLGRFLIYGHATGEIVRLDLYGSERSQEEQPRRRSRAVASAPPSRSVSVRSPTWQAPATSTEEETESAVLAVVADPPRIGLLTRNGRLRIFNTEGRDLGRSPEVTGVGRFLRTAPGWIAAATDRQIVLCDVRQLAARRLETSLFEISHLLIRPDTFGLAVVQERDRLGRLTPAGRWVWRTELKEAIEDLAIGPDDFLAASTEDGWLRIYDFGGRPAGEFQTHPAEPLGVIEAPEPTPDGAIWLSVARRSQVLRGHDRSGRVLWESPVPFEAWQTQGLGPLALVSAPDGSAVAFDSAGYLQGRSSGTGGGLDVFTESPDGEALRISRQGINLICSDFAGKVRWRSIAEAPLGPLAAASPGVAVLIGRSLAWFASEPTPSDSSTAG